MFWCFDLDGTLVDTRKAVTEAYRLAGVEMPPDAWGKPWTDWCPRHQHIQKQQHYPQMLHLHGKALPLLTVALTLNAPIITGASAIAVHIVKQQFSTKLDVRAFSLNRVQKAAWLVEHWRQGENIYVDDDAETRQIVSERTRWGAMSPEDALTRLTWQGR